MEIPEIESPITFTRASELDRLNGLVHDEYFDMETLEYDQDLGLLRIPFKRCFHGRASEILRKTLFGTTVYKVPVLICRLTIRDIVGFHLPKDTGVGFSNFNDIRYDDSSELLAITTCLGPDYRMQVSSLHIEYAEVEFCGYAKIRCGLLFDSGPTFLNQ